MANKKPHIEERKVRAEKRLATRLASLNAKGMNDSQIRRDPKFRQIQAEVRKAKMQLANIEKHERQVAEQAEAKVKKQAEAKTKKQATAKAKKQAKPKSDAPKKKKPAEAPAKKKAKKKKK